MRMLVAAAAVLMLAGCGGGTAAAPSISAGDKAACDALDRGSTPSPDAQALYSAFGVHGSVHGMSQKLAPYGLLVGGNAQLLLSGADDGRLGEFVGQMRGVCETLGWHTG